MTYFGIMAGLLVAWFMAMPKSFGRHLAEIKEAYDRARAAELEKGSK